MDCDAVTVVGNFNKKSCIRVTQANEKLVTMLTTSLQIDVHTILSRFKLTVLCYSFIKAVYSKLSYIFISDESGPNSCTMSAFNGFPADVAYKRQNNMLIVTQV